MYKFLESLLIVVVIGICAGTQTQLSQLILYGVTYAFALFSWIFLYKNFPIFRDFLDSYFKET